MDFQHAEDSALEQRQPNATESLSKTFVLMILFLIISVLPVLLRSSQIVYKMKPFAVYVNFFSWTGSVFFDYTKKTDPKLLKCANGEEI